MSEHRGPEDWEYWLDPAHRAEFSVILRQEFPGLTEEDIEDAWAEAIEQLRQRIESGRSDPRNSLGGLLLTIVRRRCRDKVRRAKSQARRIQNCQEYHTANANMHGDNSPETGCDSLEFQELQEIYARAVEQLDPDQRLVLTVYCDVYPKAKGAVSLLKILLERHPELASKNWTKSTVSRLLDRARAAVRKTLLEKGYQL